MTIVSLVLAAALVQRTTIPKPDRDSVIAFVDVHVVPMNRDGVLDHQTVIVRGNRIAQMGSSAQLQAPRGALIVNGHGKYLMPGLGDMHGGLTGPNASAELTENVLFL